MHAYELKGGFGLDNLVATEREDPQPGPGQVRVRVRFASVNYRDLLMVEGKYNPRQPLPLIPLSDGAGEVDAVGPGATMEVGTRVTGLFSPKWQSGEPSVDKIRTALGGPLDGALAQYLVLDEAAAVPVPSPPRAARGGHAALRGGDGLDRPRRRGPGQSGRHRPHPGERRRVDVRAGLRPHARRPRESRPRAATTRPPSSASAGRSRSSTTSRSRRGGRSSAR